MTKKFVLVAVVLFALYAYGVRTPQNTQASQIQEFATSYLRAEAKQQLQFVDDHSHHLFTTSLPDVKQAERNFRQQSLEKILGYSLQEVQKKQPIEGNLVISYSIDSAPKKESLDVYSNGIVQLNNGTKTDFYRLSANDIFDFTNHIHTLSGIFFQDRVQ